MTVLEDGAGGDRHLVSAPAATPAVSPNRPSLSPCAPRAHPSGGPAQGYKILGTGLVAVEALLQLQQSPGIILAHDHEHYMLGLVASSKYPYKEMTYDPPSQNDARRTRASQLRAEYHPRLPPNRRIFRVTSSALPTNSVRSTSVSTKRIYSARENSPHAPSRNGWPRCGSSSSRR